MNKLWFLILEFWLNFPQLHSSLFWLQVSILMNFQYHIIITIYPQMSSQTRCSILKVMLPMVRHFVSLFKNSEIHHLISEISFSDTPNISMVHSHNNPGISQSLPPNLANAVPPSSSCPGPNPFNHFHHQSNHRNQHPFQQQNYQRLQNAQPLQQPPTADASQLSGSIGAIPAGHLAQDQFPPNITIPPPQIRPPIAQPMQQHPTVSFFFNLGQIVAKHFEFWTCPESGLGQPPGLGLPPGVGPASWLGLTLGLACLWAWPVSGFDLSLGLACLWAWPALT